MSAITALALMALLLSPGMTSDATTPYIEIQHPTDGSLVESSFILDVVAEGYKLDNPSASISGESIGVDFPLQNCEYSEEIGTGYQKMYCSQKVDVSAFQGQEIKLVASVNSDGKPIDDSVGLYVSGNCAGFGRWGGGSSG